MVPILGILQTTVKDPRSSGSQISSAWGELALGLASAAGAVGIAALQKKAGAGTAGTDTLKANQQLNEPGQPVQKNPASKPMNKASLIVGVFVLLLAISAVWFAFKR